MDLWNLAFVAIVSVFVLVGAICDYRTTKLPNWLTVPGFVAGLLFHAIKGLVTGGLYGLGTELLNSLIGFAVGFSILLVMWLMGTGGAGDVKLMGALGAWLGAKMTLQVFFVSTLFVLVGSVLVLTYAMITGGVERMKRRYLAKPSGAAKRGVSAADHRVRRRLMPYGVPVAVATWIGLAWSMSHIPS